MQSSLQLIVHKETIQNNILKLKKLLNGVQIIPILKGNAYGHGIKTMLSILKESEITELVAVSSAYEAGVCSEILPKENILVLFPSNQYFLQLLSEGYHTMLFSLKQLKDFINHFDTIKNLPYINLHIMCNTGFQRDGLEISEFYKLLQFIRDNRLDNINTLAVASHIAANKKRYMGRIIDKHIKQFEEFKKTYESFKIKNKKTIYHTANTCATLNYPKSHYSAVRLGDCIYGFQNKDYEFPYKPAISCITKVENIKQYSKVNSLQYNQNYKIHYKGRIGVSLIGYSDGIFGIKDINYKSGRIYVVINNRLCPILSTPMMNHFIYFLPHDVEIKIGDTVHIFGPLAEKSLSLAKWSSLTNQTAGEFLLPLGRFAEHDIL